MHDAQRQLHSDGYAIVRGFFDADEMKQIGNETDRIYRGSSGRARMIQLERF